MDQKQTILLQLQELASKLKRTPTMAELECETGIGRQEIRKYYHSYSILLKAAELPPTPPANQYGFRRPPSERFLKPEQKFVDIEERLGEYFENESAKGISLPTIIRRYDEECLIVSAGDIHLPFWDVGVISSMLHYVEQLKPKVFLIPGDFYDMFAHKKFPGTRNIYNPHQEFQMARRMAEEFIAKLKKSNPGMRIILLLGNHCVRPMKKMFEAYPEGEVFFEPGYKAAFQFDGVETYMDVRENVHIIADIYSNHGHFMKLGDHCKRYRKKIICGHTHRGGTFFEDEFWELNCGVSGDIRAKCFEYTLSTQTGWTKGHGIVTTSGPRFILC